MSDYYVYILANKSNTTIYIGYTTIQKKDYMNTEITQQKDLQINTIVQNQYIMNIQTTNMKPCPEKSN